MQTRLLLFCLLLSPGLAAQPASDWGLSGGLTCSFGQPVNRLGFALQGYYRLYFAQFNAQVRGLYNFGSFGPRPRIPGLELQAGLGATLGFGPRERAPSPFIHLVSNQTGHRYAAGYAYLCYLDRQRTSQLSGVLGLHIDGWQLQSENDALAGSIEDRFRTGAFRVLYGRDQWQAALTSILWTGDTRVEGSFKVRESDYPGRFGYKDLSMDPYSAFSHGILALEAQWALPYGQVGHLGLGLDAERVRHVLQNNLIHDMWILPATWIKSKNPHIPMVDRDGRHYLFLPGQELRPARPYLHLGLNPGLFY
ncbi:MAG: hypothetical protein OHK0039_18570 [Bacteroidia bacterium]